jgi:hypothetical protein
VTQRKAFSATMVATFAGLLWASPIVASGALPISATAPSGATNSNPLVLVQGAPVPQVKENVPPKVTGRDGPPKGATSGGSGSSGRAVRVPSQAPSQVVRTPVQSPTVRVRPVEAKPVQRSRNTSERQEGRNRDRARGTRYYWGPGAEFFFFDGFYHGDCGWLRRKAEATGSRYWRQRYRQCRNT